MFARLHKRQNIWYQEHFLCRLYRLLWYYDSKERVQERFFYNRKQNCRYQESIEEVLENLFWHRYFRKVTYTDTHLDKQKDVKKSYENFHHINWGLLTFKRTSIWLSQNFDSFVIFFLSTINCYWCTFFRDMMTSKIIRY